MSLPSDRNAHPHTDPGGEIVVVHNGIIENFLSLKEALAGQPRAQNSRRDRHQGARPSDRP